MKENSNTAEQPHNKITEEIVNDIIGVSKDSTNRIGQKHLEEILEHIQSRSPIKKGVLVSQLRLKLLIGERYINEYLDGLVAYEIIKIDSGIVYWCFDDNNKASSEKPLDDSEAENVKVLRNVLKAREQHFSEITKGSTENEENKPETDTTE